jgi:hypothetical protein
LLKRAPGIAHSRGEYARQAPKALFCSPETTAPKNCFRLTGFWGHIDRSAQHCMGALGLRSALKQPEHAGNRN